MAADDGNDDEEDEEMGTRRRSSTQLAPVLPVFVSAAEEEDGLISLRIGNNSIPSKTYHYRKIGIRSVLLFAGDVNVNACRPAS